MKKEKHNSGKTTKKTIKERGKFMMAFISSTTVSILRFYASDAMQSISITITYPSLVFISSYFSYGSPSDVIFSHAIFPNTKLIKFILIILHVYAHGLGLSAYHFWYITFLLFEYKHYHYPSSSLTPLWIKTRETHVVLSDCVEVRTFRALLLNS